MCDSGVLWCWNFRLWLCALLVCVALKLRLFVVVCGADIVFCVFLLQAIRQGKMPESMQLVARVNAEAGGKVSVFDRLASTTTESRRQKVNDRDQLHENLRYYFLIRRTRMSSYCFEVSC